MANLIDGISEFFTGKSTAPANPDPSHNILLLAEARRKIETGILTRFLKRPTIYVLELVTYLITAMLFIAAILIWNRIDSLFDAYSTLNLVGGVATDKALPLSEYVWVSYVILLVLLLPSIICFLLARLFTSSKKKMKTFIQVENMIDRVIYNLKAE